MGTKVFSAIQIDPAPRISSLKKREIGYRLDTGLPLPSRDHLMENLVAVDYPPLTVGFSSRTFRREIQKGAGKWGRNLTYGDQW